MTTLTIKEKEKKLQEARKNAKLKFRGIDKQIDMFIDAITGWYLHPELQEKPVVVNLWGLTGVGKTTLVRYIIGVLGMSKIYSELLMQCSTNKKEVRSLEDYIQTSTNSPAILLLDEFQKYSTLDKDRKPKDSIPFPELWSLLSDGSIRDVKSCIHTLTTCLGDMVSVKVSLVRDVLRQTEGAEGEEILGDSGECSHSVDIQIEGDMGESEIQLYNTYTFSQLNDIYMRSSTGLARTVYISNLYCIGKNAIKGLSGKHTFASLRCLTYEQLEKLLKDQLEMYNSEKGLESTKYKQLLIIIAGNRDELYSQSQDLYLTYKDVDTVYEDTKDYKWYQLRNLLLDSLAPEHINRLGMTHILFPSLNSKAYKQIIKDNLNNKIKEYKKQFGATVKFEESVYTSVYKNSVFPTQGVRPILSFIDSSIQSSLVSYLSTSKSKSVTVEIDEENYKLIVKADKKVVKYPLVLEISERENSIPEECRVSTAVHEAGHAIASMFLWDCNPTIEMAPMIDGVLGYTSDNNDKKVENTIGSLHKYLKGYVCMGLAGKAAEESVFGVDNLSRGCSSDLRHVTSLVFQMIKKWGLDSNIVATSSSDFMASLSKTTNTEQEDLKAEYILNEAYSNALEIIKITKPVFIEMVEYLKENSYMSKEKSKEFLKKVKKIRSANSISSYSEKKYWNKFISKK